MSFLLFLLQCWQSSSTTSLCESPMNLGDPLAYSLIFFSAISPCGLAWVCLARVATLQLISCKLLFVVFYNWRFVLICTMPVWKVVTASDASNSTPWTARLDLLTSRSVHKMKYIFLNATGGGYSWSGFSAD